MSTVLSLPLAPPQSSDRFAPVQSLYLFKTYDRSSAHQTFGEEPPQFDPTRQIKAWKDDSVASLPGDQIVTYKMFKNVNLGNGKYRPSLIDVTMKASVASTFNVTGKPNYAVYVPAPTSAFISSGGAYVSTFNPLYLSSLEQASALAALISGAVVGQQSLGGPFTYTYPADESRRLFTIQTQYQFPGAAPGPAVFNVGQLIWQMNQAGVGAPGHWDPSALKQGNYAWSQDVVPDGNDGLPHPIYGIPCRTLLKNEILVNVQELISLVTFVERTDISA